MDQNSFAHFLILFPDWLKIEIHCESPISISRALEKIPDLMEMVPPKWGSRLGRVFLILGGAKRAFIIGKTYIKVILLFYFAARAMK